MSEGRMSNKMFLDWPRINLFVPPTPKLFYAGTSVAVEK